MDTLEFNTILDVEQNESSDSPLIAELEEKGFVVDLPSEVRLTKAGLLLWHVAVAYGFPYEPIVRALGWGRYGAAYQLEDGNVLKITTDPQELICINKLAKVEHPNIAEVYDAGVFFQQGGSVLGYYIREPLDDIHYSRRIGFEDFKQLARQIEEDTGVYLLDMAQFENWGQRPETGEIVFRDLNCS